MIPETPKQKLRKLAEERAGKEEMQSILEFMPEDVKKLLHELRVHQIELEMQNEELQRAMDELEDSNMRYFDLYNMAPVGYCTLSDQGVILEANLTATELLGVSRNALTRKSLTSFVLPDDQDIFYQHRKRLFETNEPQSCELRIMKKGTGYFWANLEATTARDQDGNPVCRITLNDITGLKKAEEEINLRNEQLQENNKQKDKFFSIVAHDLRSPFNSFLGFTKLLAEELHEMSEEDIQKIANALQKSATNLYNLLSNLLAWSRMQQGVMEFNPATSSLTTIVQKATDSFSDQALQKGLVLQFEAPEDLQVFVDEPMIESTLRNLISNAVKFTSRGGEVHISARRASNNSIEVSVSDTGTGMNPESLRNLFSLTEHPTQKGTEGEPSTGLGLLLCKEFVEKHGGTIRAESEVGVGSTFRITLPGGGEK
ncbi:MAG: PAS domain-containing sensor histidine kinase [Bacteroidales bacterium]|nr:PAS domain-containing sensor histidine kinase [Bacteroidales bacterium]